MPLPKGPAFVTGGSSGIGLATAQALAGRGHPVALLARRPEMLAAAREAILSRHPAARVHVEVADVTDPEALDLAVQGAVAALGRPALLICSAGITAPGRFADISAPTHRRVMEVNYFGTLNALHATLPLLLPGGRVALIASAAGLAGFYGYGAYAPSKFALRGLAEILRVELAQEGIGLTLCLPPDTDTPQLAAEIPLRPQVTSRIAALGSVMSAEEVAEALVRGLAANRFLVLPGAPLKALHVFSGVLGPTLRALQRHFLRQSQRRPE